MRIVLAVVAVLIGALVALVGFAPASLADYGLRRATQGRLALAETEGTIWHGSARLVLVDINDRSPEQLTLAGVAIPGRMRWQVRILPLMVGALRANVRLDGMSEDIAIDGSVGELRVGRGMLSLPSVDLGRLGSPWNTVRPSGALAVRWEGLTLRPGVFDGRANIELRDMASALTPVRPLGSYRIGVAGEGGSARLDIQTLQGPLNLEGDGVWTQARGVQFTAQASADPEQRDRLQNLLGLLGRRQGDKTLIKIGARG
ncbi:MAG: type II secretion system protein N [Burkholderiaceae bacterium]